MINGSAFFGIPHKIIDDIMRRPQLPNLFLHGVLKDTFLFAYKCSLLFVVENALAVALCPVAAPSVPPPCAPCMVASSTAIGTSIVSFFASSGALSAGAKAAAFVADCSEKTAATEDGQGNLQSHDKRRLFGRSGRKFSLVYVSFGCKRKR